MSCASADDRHIGCIDDRLPITDRHGWFISNRPSVIWFYHSVIILYSWYIDGAIVHFSKIIGKYDNILNDL